jgi:hypothetical protein
MTLELLMAWKSSQSKLFAHVFYKRSYRSMLLVAGLTLKNLKPRVWDVSSPYYLSNSQIGKPLV